MFFWLLCYHNNMKRIEEMNGIFIYSDYHYENIKPPFLDSIYRQCSLKYISIIKKFWFDPLNFYFFRCLDYFDCLPCNL